MSTYWTWQMISDKIENDLDLQSEIFISPTELLAYGNEAIREAEAEIHGIYEDYFLSKSTLTLVTGQEEYDVPSDLYAHKIRRIVYRNGTKCYTIDRIRDWKKFEEYALELINKSSTTYNYFLINSTAGSPKILMSPPAKEDGPFITIWYLREANRLVNSTDNCDIPEFVNFVIQYIKVRCYEKEVGHPALPKAMADLEQQRQQMTSTLASMVPDANNEIEADLSLYNEMS